MDSSEKKLFDNLLKKLDKAEKRNRYYEELLRKNGISFAQTETLKPEETLTEALSATPKEVSEVQKPQGKQLPVIELITAFHIDLFRSVFRGREEFYAKRTKYQTYTRPCWNRYADNGLCRKQSDSKFPCKECKVQAFRQLSDDTIRKHLEGNAEDCSDVIGIYPITRDNTCWFLVFDFDDHNHTGIYVNASHKDTLTGKDLSFWKEVQSLAQICQTYSVPYLLERSRSGFGAHLWIFFDTAIPCVDARRFGICLLSEGMKLVNTTSFKTYDRMMPMQDALEENQAGNLIALPLQGRALRNGNSAFVDDNGQAFLRQWDVLRNLKRYPEKELFQRLEQWKNDDPYGPSNTLLDSEEDPTKPWDADQTSLKLVDVQGKAEIVLANGIYVKKDNLKVRMQNRIRRLALYRNPEYYKAKKRNNEISAMKNPYFIYCGRDIQNYIFLPRGCQKVLYDALDAGDIEYTVIEKYAPKRSIDISFTGELRQNQKEAAASLSGRSCGIISAATAFGKTVLGAAIIAERKVSTLILVNRSEIMDGWFDTLTELLEIKEELPTYQTPKGRIKTRSTCIGRYGSGKKELNGIVDIAMIQSLVDKGKVKDELAPIIKSYGLVIVDECHHVAGDEYQILLNSIFATYVYGFTATPKRYDSQDQKMYFQLGSIYYRFSAKDRAKELNFDHLVYPRFTPSVNIDHESNDYGKMLDLLTEDDVRNKLIVSDVVQCLNQKRTPIILTKRIKHAQKLYELLKGKADHVFLMAGSAKASEVKQQKEERKQASAQETVVLIATGSKAGEGFNYPRLDTLMLAAPVSWEGSIEQYTGRLNRSYEGKQNVIVFDYVDSGIPMFERMYRKRLSTYRQIGFDVCAAMKEETIEKSSIYTGKTFIPDFLQDLRSASKDAVIFSPYLSNSTVHMFTDSVLEMIQDGLLIRVVTIAPDQMEEDYQDSQKKKIRILRTAGILVSEASVRKMDTNFAIIDRKTIWYGNMNLLGKNDEDNELIRFTDDSTAVQLLNHGLRQAKIRTVTHGLQERLDL